MTSKIDYRRWLGPVIITFMLLVVLLKRNEIEIFLFSERRYIILTSTICVWVGMTWWIALSNERYLRVLNRRAYFPSFKLGGIVVGLLLLTDIFFDLTFIVPFIPLLPVIVMLLVITTDFRPTDYWLEGINKGTVLVSSLIIGLVIIEIVFRFLFLEDETPITNEQFIDLFAPQWPHQIATDKPPNTFRILGLADSFGTAGGYKNYHYQLETLLQDEGINVEMVNFSVGAYQPPHQLELLKRFGPQYQPNFVLHGFFVGNDFVVFKDRLVSYHNITFSPLVPEDDFVRHRFRSFLFIQWARNVIKLQKEQSQKRVEIAADPFEPEQASTDSGVIPPERTNELAGTFSVEAFLRIERDRLEIFRWPPSTSGHWHATETVKLLDQIRETVEQMGAEYVMVIHPDQIQVERDLLQHVVEKYDLDLDQYDLSLPQNFLKQYCLDRHIRCLDLYPVFREHGEEGGLYLLRDTHYNDQGNKLAAEALFHFLYDDLAQSNVLAK